MSPILIPPRAEARMGRVTRVLGRARRQCWGFFTGRPTATLLKRTEVGVLLSFKKALDRGPRDGPEGGGGLTSFRPSLLGTKNKK